MPTVLVVDDEPAIRALLRATLASSGYSVLEAAEGPQALELARSRRPNLVLLDIALPRLSGLEICRRLKADPATAAAPVLLLTGLAPASERQAASDVGAAGFVTKPFLPQQLLAVVAEALRLPAATSR